MSPSDADANTMHDLAEALRATRDALCVALDPFNDDAVFGHASKVIIPQADQALAAYDARPRAGGRAQP